MKRYKFKKAENKFFTLIAKEYNYSKPRKNGLAKTIIFRYRDLFQTPRTDTAIIARYYQACEEAGKPRSEDRKPNKDTQTQLELTPESQDKPQYLIKLTRKPKTSAWQDLCNAFKRLLKGE